MIMHDLSRPFSSVFTFVIQPQEVHGGRGVAWKSTFNGIFGNVISLDLFLNTINQPKLLDITSPDLFFDFNICIKTTAGFTGGSSGVNLTFLDIFAPAVSPYQSKSMWNH